MFRSTARSRRLVPAVIVSAVALVAVGCGSDDTESGDQSEATTTVAPSSTDGAASDATTTTAETDDDGGDTSAGYSTKAFRWTDADGWVRKVEVRFTDFGKDSFAFTKVVADSPPGKARLASHLDSGSSVDVEVTGDTPGRTVPEVSAPRVSAWFPAPASQELDGATASERPRYTRCYWVGSIYNDLGAEMLNTTAQARSHGMVEDATRFDPEGGLDCINITSRVEPTTAAGVLAKDMDEATVDALVQTTTAFGAPVVKIQLTGADHFDGSCTIFLFPDGSTQIGRWVQLTDSVGAATNGEAGRCKVERA